MKKVKILSNCLIPSGEEGQMKTAYVGSVLELDDAVAGNLIAAQRAVAADKADKVVDTTKEHEAAAAKRAEASGEGGLAAVVAAAVQAALAAKPAA